MLVDARSGDVVRRSNHVKFAVNADVFEYNPATRARISKDLAPWLNSSTTLEGPNAHAFLDVHDTVGVQPSGAFQLTPEPGSEVVPGNYPLRTVPRPGSGDDCPAGNTDPPSALCTWNPLDDLSWDENKEQSATQLFYLVNTFHDHLRDDPNIRSSMASFRVNPGQPIGDPNVGAAGGASDPVLAQALDGADTASGLPDEDHINNSNFLTLPDGNPGLMQMYLWGPPPFGGYDGANDAATVFHEYAHGLSGRLVTDAAGFEALGSPQAGAMSEGLSDFYALDYLASQGLLTDTAGTANVRFGQATSTARRPARASGCSRSIARLGRPSPCPIRRRTCRHRLLHIWGLREDRKRRAGGPRRRRDLGSDAVVAARRAGRGGHATLRHHAMRLSPPEPSFLDMRNAILQASTDEGDDQLIWQVFAARGMGYFASTTAAATSIPSPNNTVPPAAPAAGMISGIVQGRRRRSDGRGEVGIAGHDTPFDGVLGPELEDTTGADGSYSITAPIGTYPLLHARRSRLPRRQGRAGDDQSGDDLHAAAHPGARLVVNDERSDGRAVQRHRQHRQRLRTGRR